MFYSGEQVCSGAERPNTVWFVIIWQAVEILWGGGGNIPKAHIWFFLHIPKNFFFLSQKSPWVPRYPLLLVGGDLASSGLSLVSCSSNICLIHVGSPTSLAVSSLLVHFLPDPPDLGDLTNHPSLASRICHRWGHPGDRSFSLGGALKITVPKVAVTSWSPCVSMLFCHSLNTPVCLGSRGVRKRPWPFAIPLAELESLGHHFISHVPLGKFPSPSSWSFLAYKMGMIMISTGTGWLLDWIVKCVIPQVGNKCSINVSFLHLPQLLPGVRKQSLSCFSLSSHAASFLGLTP